MTEKRVISNSITLRFGVLMATAAVVLLNARVLGAEGQGQVAVFQLGMLLISACSGFIAGGAVVFLKQQLAVKAMWQAGHIWMACCTLSVGSFLLWVGNFPHIGAIAVAGWLQAGIIFHGQILLATGSIKAHNRLAFIQTLLLAVGLLFAYANGWRELEAFVAVLLGALTLTALDAMRSVYSKIEPSESGLDATTWRQLWLYGRSAQTGALFQLLSNRLPFAWLARLGQNGTAQAGLYSIAFYGMEAMWTAARALAPVLHARTAENKDRASRILTTRAFATLTFVISLVLWLISAAVPEFVYERIFEVDGIRGVLVVLGPAVICGSVAGIFSHHLSGIGQHRWNAWTSGAGLTTVILLGALWYEKNGSIGAAAAASVAGFVQVLGLFIGMTREEQIKGAEWLPRRGDWAQIKSNKS